MSSNLRTAVVEWLGDERFAAGAPDGPRHFLDGTGGSAPSPVVALLNAAGSCAAVDVVTILQKKRVALRSLRAELTGTRREEIPRRYTAIHVVWHLAGEGLDETKARHAVELSMTKYCSVLSSLDPAIPVTFEIRLG